VSDVGDARRVAGVGVVVAAGIVHEVVVIALAMSVAAVHDGETERERLGVGGMSDASGVGGADSGCENEGHRVLARLAAAGIAARRSRGELCRSGAHFKKRNARVHGRVGWRTADRTVGERWVMSATYSG
jgi:hypothetical protein